MQQRVEIVPILDKRPGSRRSPAQSARNLEAFKLLSAGKLAPGQLFRIVTGAAGPAQKIKTRNTGKCIECGRDKDRAGIPLKSQPLRCKPCGKEKRAAHYAAAKGS